MKLSDMVRCGICAGLMAICAWITIPIGGTVITMQTFGLLFTLSYLGGSQGTITCIVYLLLGLVGLPVFSGFQGGPGVFLGPTGGYLIGFLLGSLSYRLLEKHLPIPLNMVITILLSYLCGTGWYYYLYARDGLWLILLHTVLPCVLPDAAKIFLAITIQKRLKSPK